MEKIRDKDNEHVIVESLRHRTNMSPEEKKEIAEFGEEIRNIMVRAKLGKWKIIKEDEHPVPSG